MNLAGFEKVKEIPDLSMAIYLKKLDLTCCSSLLERSCSIQYLNKLEELRMEFLHNSEDSFDRNQPRVSLSPESFPVISAKPMSDLSLHTQESQFLPLTITYSRVFRFVYDMMFC